MMTEDDDNQNHLSYNRLTYCMIQCMIQLVSTVVLYSLHTASYKSIFPVLPILPVVVTLQPV